MNEENLCKFSFMYIWYIWEVWQQLIMINGLTVYIERSSNCTFFSRTEQTELLCKDNLIFAT